MVDKKIEKIQRFIEKELFIVENDYKYLVQVENMLDLLDDEKEKMNLILPYFWIIKENETYMRKQDFDIETATNHGYPSVAKIIREFWDMDKAPDIHYPIKNMYRCFKSGAICPRDITENKNLVFIGTPFEDKYHIVYDDGVKPALKELGLKPWRADENISNMDIMCKICDAIQRSKFAIIDISSWNPNVLFELGLIYGFGKNALIIKNKNDDVPVDLKGMEYIPYSKPKDVQKSIRKFFKDI